MQRVNIEGLYAVVSACLPHFADAASTAAKGRIIVVSPPIYSRFVRGKTAYAIGKIGMSVFTTGLAMDFAREAKTEMAITSLWPATAIQSAATRREDARDLRTANVFSDAVLQILKAAPQHVNGRCLVDEDFLRETGVTEFARYSVVPGSVPRRMMPARFPDLSVAEQEDEGKRMDSTVLRASKL